MQMFRVSKQLFTLLLKKRTPFIQTVPKAFISKPFAGFSETIGKKIEKIHELKFNDDWNQIISRQGSVVLDFYANWCGPCKKLYPVLTQKASSLDSKWNLVYVNIDEFPDLAEQYQVQAVPTVVLLQEGKVADKFVGFPADDKLNAFLAKANAK